MQNAISTDQSVLVLVNAELNQGWRLKEIFARGITLVDYDKDDQQRVVKMKGPTLKRRYYSAKRKFNIDHLRSQGFIFMGRDLVFSSIFEPPVIHPVGRPRKKIALRSN
jgi:hypothetical protein